MRKLKFGSMKVKDIINKAKSIKNIEIILAVAVGIVAVVLCFVDFTPKETTDTFEEYAQRQETEIEEILGRIDGVRNISVSITYTSGVEQVYAYNTTTKTQNGITTEESEVILIDDQPLIEQELLPKVSGVLVVMEGDAIARFKVVQALVTLLSIDQNQIQVY